MKTVFRACTLCEAICGLRFEVEGDRILRVRPDEDDPISQGYVCPKGMAIAKVHDDPDRLRQPLRRVAPDRFEPIAWPEALELAAAGLARVRGQHGRDAVAVYWGNPIIHNHGALLVRHALNSALGTRNVFGAGSQDVSPRFATSYHLYGSSLSLPVPDVDRTDYFLCVGANPLVSNGSVMTAPDLRGRLRRLRARGGKLVVVDPRRSETADEADEHVAIRPGTDAALLLAMAAVIVRSGAAALDSLRARCFGWDEVEARLRVLDLDACAGWTGVPQETIVRLAREFAARPSSVAYSRVGVCNGRFGTLGTYATDLLNVVAGRLGSVGGAMFPTPALDVRRITRPLRLDGHERWRTRVRGLPETLGEVPCAALAEEIETPGVGQVRALLTFAGNPVLSAPNGKRIAAALGGLEFMVSIDLYVNETTRHADLILPPAWSLAEEHFDVFFPLMSVRNAVRRSPPVVERREGELHDWEILLALVNGLGGGPLGVPALDAVWRVAERLGARWSPGPLLAFLLRTGRYGDRFLPWRKGLSPRDLDAAPHGIDLGPLEAGTGHAVFHRGGRVKLAPPPLLRAWSELEAALARGVPADALLLIGRRDLRTNNSWMHNVPSLVSGSERCLLFVHPKDAEARGLTDGEHAILESRVHRGAVRVRVTEEIAPGVVSLPHGWGHAASAAWQRVAGHHAGVSVNDWTDDAQVEGVVGQSILNGVPVQLHALGRGEAAAREVA
ncbi:MAG TPA: molybdopterin-dependent oxidoreductase [Myxococcota bacterium]|nr:molybdopterin-dependent oxidoreductase [Myxococcota bacterium]